jgi:hypothetical protein
MNYLTENTASHLLSRLIVFWPHARCARALQVSIPTLERWLIDRRIPHRQLMRFERATDMLVRHLKSQAKKLPQPNAFDEAVKLVRRLVEIEVETRDRANIDAFVKEFRALLRKPTDVGEVMRLARKHKVSRTRTYFIAHQLGVRKRVLGVGRNMTSKWGLP